MKAGGFRIRPFKAMEHGKVRRGFQVVGYLDGERIRKRCRSREEALGEKNRLEVRAANADHVRAVNTRLTGQQLAEAEAAFVVLRGRSLTEAVGWYLANYRPPVVAMPLADAVATFLAARKGMVEDVHLADARRKLDLLMQWFPSCRVHEIDGGTLLAKFGERRWAPKTWNNVRGILHRFFDFCAHDLRRWISANPVALIEPRKVTRGLPTIETTARIAELFAYLETFTGSARRPHPPGFLVPYFALATFAGLRPSVPGGEIWKLGHLHDLSRAIDLELGVIRISPEVAKTDEVRQVKIRPNLKAWLQRYPLRDYPIVMPNLQALVTGVRTRFGLADDVLRHTYISMHVAKWKSLGEAALEAGNSEAMIKRHYLNIVGEAEAEKFWGIMPIA